MHDNTVVGENIGLIYVVSANRDVLIVRNWATLLRYAAVEQLIDKTPGSVRTGRRDVKQKTHLVNSKGSTGNEYSLFQVGQTDSSVNL